MSFSSRAAVLDAPHRFVLVDRPVPAPRPGDVVVRVAATAVCRTDLEIYTGHHPGVRYPRVMGHEATGVVEAVGVDVRRLSPGQRVVIDPIIACGECDCCRRGQGNLCRNAGLLGREMDGTLGEHVVLPERYVHVLPAHLPLAAATLIETLATVRHAQQRVGIAAGDAVVVLGQGATGLLHTRLAKLTGARPVIGVSRSGWKLDLARRFGADHVVGDGQDAAAAVARLTDGRGADVVIDTAGGSDLLALSMQMVRPGGRLLLYAISHRPVEGVTTFPIYFKELTIYGARALTSGDFEPCIELAASGAIDLAPFVTAEYPLARVESAFADYERAPERVLRLVIVPE
jgi:2-desacetyl-2-hydroxyethyl bacteriochlorophyllide A dehydrogenase